MDDVDIAMRELQKLPAKKHKDKKNEEKTVGKKKYTPPFELLTVQEVADALRISTATIYRMVNISNSSYDEEFPQPVRVGSNSTMWRADEITAYMLGLKRGVAGPINASKKTPSLPK